MPPVPPSRVLITREVKKWFRERKSLINTASAMRKALPRKNTREYRHSDNVP
jgi:hypothetical protein